MAMTITASFKLQHLQRFWQAMFSEIIIYSKLNVFQGHGLLVAAHGFSGVTQGLKVLF